MLCRIPPATAALTAAALASSLVLGGCSTNTSGAVTHTPALQTVGGRNTARSAVQSAILIAETTNGIALPGGPTPAGALRRFAALVHARRASGTLRAPSATGTSTGACNNGVKQSQTTASSGAQTTVTDYYYDAACTNLEAEESITVSTPSTPGNTNGTGTITVYSSSGALRVVESLAMTVSSTTSSSAGTTTENYTLTDNASATAGGTTTSSVGATCTGQPGSATLTCSIAHDGNSAGTAFGESLATSATAGAPGSSNTATINMAFYTSPTVGIAQSGTTWGITGATAYNSGTTNFTYTSSGTTGSGTMTMSDSLYTYVDTVTLSSTGITQSIVENPNSEGVTTTTNIATSTTDRTGTGTLTYADGVSEPIAGGLVGF
ncbi:MAG TPA: hypothetical protein VHS78_05355 [Candidatus Elarobacter sp.]|jgi:hypothetical protein|nr:hypothetical protein [Candidatus Elarobacter sp.]